MTALAEREARQPKRGDLSGGVPRIWGKALSPFLPKNRWHVFVWAFQHSPSDWSATNYLLAMYSAYVRFFVWLDTVIHRGGAPLLG
jgi:hypothetical protein